ncbi:MAG: hypothetical protein HQL38_15835, partial [Alphaproteobacteria bacterium]|nr:hypothetical protein [Alphaproteobacteria bacterium]
HLRSVAEVTGYEADAIDGRIGRLEDLLAGGAPGWPIRWLVVETARWLPGRRVLAAPGWVTGIDWIGRRVTLDVSRAQVASSPAEPAESELTEDWEDKVYAHYGKDRGAGRRGLDRS